MIKIGIIGTGFIAKGFYFFSLHQPDMDVKCFLTRTNTRLRRDLPQNLLTNNIDKLIQESDVILECSGDTTYATDCIEYVRKECRHPVITMNSELHITTGRYFYDKMLMVEAEGDQSGCFFQFDKEIKEMGFTPLVYGNYKNYLKTNVSLKQAKYWSDKNGVSLDKTIAFTDGSKVEIENVFTANSLNADFYDGEIVGDKLEFLIEKSKKTGKSYIDFFLDPNAPRGIFIATKHNLNQQNYLKYLKFDSNYQLLERPFHFCHLEIFKTIKNVLENRLDCLMKNNLNKYMIASITKKSLKKGQHIPIGLGSIEILGKHYKYNKELLPITLIKDMIIKRKLPKDHLLTFDDVYFKDNLAIDIWRGDVK